MLLVDAVERVDDFDPQNLNVSVGTGGERGAFVRGIADDFTIVLDGAALRARLMSRGAAVS